MIDQATCDCSLMSSSVSIRPPSRATIIGCCTATPVEPRSDSPATRRDDLSAARRLLIEEADEATTTGGQNVIGTRRTYETRRT